MSLLIFIGMDESDGVYLQLMAVELSLPALDCVPPIMYQRNMSVFVFFSLIFVFPILI